MMPASWNGMSSTGRSELARPPDPPIAVEIRPIRTARRMRLRFDEARGVLKLTCPPRTSAAKALRWVEEQRDWIEAQIAASGAGMPFEPGATIPIEGAEVLLIWAETGTRAANLGEGTLRIGGPRAAFERRVENFLRRHALEVMSAEVAEFARAANVAASSVSVGDASTRWGSCSSKGRIRLSWRLILASPEVRRFVVAHEVAHLVHLDHGPRFRALERQLVGNGLDQAKKQLRLEGPRLRRLGRRR